jgi:hypothetical protein
LQKRKRAYLHFLFPSVITSALYKTRTLSCILNTDETRYLEVNNRTNNHAILVIIMLV